MPPLFRDHLIVFTRYPEAGVTKTRLIPVLGAEGAAALQRRMTERLLRELKPLILSRSLHFEVRFAGGSPKKMQRWLGPGYTYTPQGSGGLGQRMETALHEGFSAGAKAVVVIGTDIPGITARIIDSAYDSLGRSDVVFGPAADGGYYLIGLHQSSAARALPHVFTDIPWGTNRVMALSQEKAAGLGLSVSLTPFLADVDRPDDLSVWEDLTGETVLRTDSRRISVIIPALDEAGCITATIRGAQHAENVEIIVVDGGSRDGTQDLARAAGATVLSSAPPRSCQMNVGAAFSHGGILLFLHADTRLPEGYAELVRRCLAGSDSVAGAFALRIDSPGRSMRIMEQVANWRSRYFKKPYGDQALFMTTARFQAVGGFPAIPIMEDFEIVRRLGQGGRITILSAPVTTSARRWLQMGVWRTWLVNQAMVVAYFCGIAPRVLARLYRGHR